MVRETWATIRRYWFVLVAGVLLGGMVGLVSTARQRLMFDGVGRIEVPQNPLTRRFTLAQGRDDPSSQLVTEMSTIGGDRILNRVAVDLDLANNPAFLGIQDHTLPEAQRSWPAQQLAVYLLRRGLTVRLVPYTTIVRIDFYCSDPKLAAAVVNALMDEFIADRFDSQNRLRARANRFLGPDLQQLQASMTAAQNRMLELRQQLGVPDYNQRNSQLAEVLTDLTNQLVEARLQLGRDASNLRAVLDRERQGSAEELAGTPPAGSVPEAGRDERNLLSRSRVRQATLAASAGPNNPDLLAAKARTETLERVQAAEARDLVQRLRAQADATHLEVEQLTRELERQAAHARELTPAIANYAEEQEEYTASRSLFDRFAYRLEIAPANLAFRDGMVDIVGRAAVYKVSPRRTLLEGAARSALVGLGLALFVLVPGRYLYWPSVRTEGFESMTGHAALATMPRLKDVALLDVLDAVGGDGPADGEARDRAIHPDFIQGLFDIRLQLEAGPRGSRPRCILFTSARPAEGKTTLATSLAVVMARRGRRVLLIDADLRRPTVARRLRLQRAPGLSDVLSGRVRLAEVVHVLPAAPTLDILTSGPVPPDPVKLIESPQMNALLDEASRRYETIVIDAPPVLPVTDSILLAQQADAVVWVIRANRWQRLALWRAGEVLETGRVPLCGIVVNGLDKPSAVTDAGPHLDLFLRWRQWQNARGNH